MSCIAQGFYRAPVQGSRVRYAIADFTVPALIQQAGASVLGQIEELAALADPSE